MIFGNKPSAHPETTRVPVPGDEYRVRLILIGVGNYTVGQKQEHATTVSITRTVRGENYAPFSRATDASNASSCTRSFAPSAIR